MKEFTLNNGKLKWIHLVNPKGSDVDQLKPLLNVHPLILDEILNPSDRSKVEEHNGYVFLVYHFPLYNQVERTSRRAEIDFIATKNLLITISYEELEPITQFEEDSKTKWKEICISPAQLIYYIIENIHEYSIRQLKHVEKKVNFVGEQLFKHQDRSLLEEISYIKRDILEFSLVAVPQRTVLESLADVGTRFWGIKFRPYFSDLAGDFLKTQYLLDNLKATIESYSETVSQIFQFKTSEVIRRFSILGFLTFPLILYATISLQPRVEATFISQPLDFWVFFFLITAILLGIAIFFRKKGWL